MEERKSMGSALVDVFDAGVALVKSEVKGLVRRASDIAKEKGIGVVLMLAAVAPLTMGLIFLILTFFFGLMALGLGAWAAALIIAIVSFLVTGGLIFLGIQKLGAGLEEEASQQWKLEEAQPVTTPMSEAGAGIVQPRVKAAESVAESEGNDDLQHEVKAQATQSRVDENVQNPTVLKDQPGIQVSTTQTFRSDMKEGKHND